MQAIKIEVTGAHPPPTGNPLSLYVRANRGIEALECSPSVWLPPNLKLEVESAIDGLYVTSHTIQDGRVILLFRAESEIPKKGMLVAYGSIVERPLANVRFMHKDNKGRRIVTGEAMPIEESGSKISDS